ncbi:FAD-dependent monooxygenase [Actinorugispora endophytica]|uniref:Pentachlorophenol monooxygenase/3-(3-hydroxy-phenyl)propionate hydroxylase n=1 Tax=Actinorugispora endophytica TaxID=1605990 RepID=A0A4R6USQ0_9ACTN|nr:FAD-dependent monooxygenase [Actinorugispora endophytica]TDQ49286.1 pentachlorophenol monooxygenase/3-(3-hydroxy-phenyl)propionate hydroxylase [Actinorugispora endophytica]
MTSTIPSPAPPGDDSAQGPPVLISGAGPVGLCAALTLARFGVPTVLFESRPEPDDDHLRYSGSRAICFQRDVLDVFDRLGVAAPLLAEGTTWTTARTYYRGHEVRTVVFPAAPEAGEYAPLPPWINVSQARVEQELLRAADANPLVTVRYRSRVTALTQDGGGVIARTAGWGGTELIRGSHLVGADGASSAVRKLMGVGFPGGSFDDRFLICDIRADLPFPNERRFYFDPEWNPGRQVLVHQCPDSTWRIDWQVPDDYDLEAERAGGALDERVRRITGDRPYDIVWSSVYRFHERCAERFRVGRVLLAGDAAHLYAPFGARGLNSGVQDAENLGWKIAAARALPAGAADALLESYHQERWAAAQENLRVTGDTMRFLVPPDEHYARLRRETLELAVTDAGARDRIDSGRLAEPFWYTGSPLTTPPEVPEPLPADARGGHPPVPGVICPDGPCRAPDGTGTTRLRGRLEPAVTVLVAHARQADALAGAVRDTPIPVRVLVLDEVDPGGALAAALRCDGGTAHVVRPDAHLCAVLPVEDAEAVRAALRRLFARAGPAAGGGEERHEERRLLPPLANER